MAALPGVKVQHRNRAMTESMSVAELKPAPAAPVFRRLRLTHKDKSVSTANVFHVVDCVQLGVITGGFIIPKPIGGDFITGLLKALGNPPEPEAVLVLGRDVNLTCFHQLSP